MPLDEFWHGEAELFFAYRTAYIMTEKEKLDYDNYLAWLSGSYNLRALWEVHSNLNLPENRKHEAIKYFEKPISIFDTSNKKKKKNDIIAERRKEEENKIKLMIANTQLSLKKKKKKLVI